VATKGSFTGLRQDPSALHRGHLLHLGVKRTRCIVTKTVFTNRLGEQFRRRLRVHAGGYPHSAPIPSGLLHPPSAPASAQ
jgi:hypothetical protein